MCHTAPSGRLEERKAIDLLLLNKPCPVSISPAELIRHETGQRLVRNEGHWVTKQTASIHKTQGFIPTRFFIAKRSLPRSPTRKQTRRNYYFTCASSHKWTRYPCQQRWLEHRKAGNWRKLYNNLRILILFNYRRTCPLNSAYIWFDRWALNTLPRTSQARVHKSMNSDFVNVLSVS